MRLWFALLALAPPLTAAQNAFPIDLSGEWRMSPDDNPRYADPAFGDGGWPTVDLPWTTPLPSGVYWLRHAVTLPAGAESHELALTLGALNEIYELFINGVKAGSTGQLNTWDLEIARPRTFPIPPRLLNSGKPQLIAIRVWRPYEIVISGMLRTPDAGPYVITDRAAAPTEASGLAVFVHRAKYSTDDVVASIGVTLGILILLAWLSDKPRRELLWLGLLLLGDALHRAAVLSQISLTSHPSHADPWLQLLAAAILGFQFELAIAASGFGNRWLRMAGWLLVMAGNGVAYLDPGRVRAVTRELVLYPTAGILIVAIARTLRSQRFSSRFWLLAILLAGLVDRLRGYLNQTVLHRRTWIDVGDYKWELSGLFLVLTGFLVSVLLMRELLADRREKQRLAGELEAARVVQSLLHRTPRIGGNRVDTVYLSALEVGGDFYAVLDDSVLIVGDVSGKGLKAAMMVSLLIGVLRGMAARRPREVLEALNSVVAERAQGGFVTCICAQFGADNRVTLANAGHLAPYRDGQELSLETGLPLGIEPDAVFAEQELEMGEQLTFLSDGVVEATSGSGELFGFERTREKSTQSAVAIAQAARAWGQNDDITVVTVRRTA